VTDQDQEKSLVLRPLAIPALAIALAGMRRRSAGLVLVGGFLLRRAAKLTSRRRSG
jgi:hypothetical protein